MTDKGSSIQRLGQQMMNPSIPQSRIQHPRNTQELEQQEFLQQGSLEMDQIQNQMVHLNLQKPWPRASNGWSGEFQHYTLSQQAIQDSEFETIYTKGATRYSNWNQEFQSHQQMFSIQEFQEYQKTRSEMDQHIDWNKEFAKYSKGKEPMSDQDWKNEFTKYDETEPINWSNEFEDLEQQPESVYAGDTADWQSQFNQIWKEMQESKKSLGSDWASEFQNIFPADIEGERTEADPVFSPCEPYYFEEMNEFINHPDPYKAGLELIISQESLSLAALAFEAAVQRDEHNDDAWLRLGKIQAENEKELPAIAALQKAVQMNPKNSEALMSLAVSYTNEGRNNEAYATLERWLKTIYPDLVMPPLDRESDMHNRLQKYYIEAVQKDTTKVDSNIQVGLGLLFYNVQDYDKTIDCFTTALSVRPDDYLLWNRLGATLSNSGKNEEAIGAYHKALELKPSFVRARYNLGVSSMNIGCYREAAEHFLGALSLHVVHSEKQVNVSKTIWDTLYRDFILMERKDLADLALKQTEISNFRKEFEF